MEFITLGMHHRVILSRVIYFLHSTLSSLPLLVSLLFLSLVSVSSFSLLFLSLIHKLYTPWIPGSTITLVWLIPVVLMSQDDAVRSDLPAGGQEELGGVSHSERMMADMMKMLANLTMQNQQHLQQQQQTTAAAGDRGQHQQLAAGEGCRVQESGGAREGRVVDSSGLLVGETSAKLESLSGEGRQASVAGSYPAFRVAGQAPLEDVPRRHGQRRM